MIRKMTEADALRIRDWLHVEYEKNGDDGLYSNFHTWLWNREYMQCLVYKNEHGYPIGFITYNLNSNELDLLSIMESERRDGIGTKLVKRVLKDKIGTIKLTACNGSYEFWKSFGFEEMQKDEDRLKEDLLLGVGINMIKKVDK